MSKLKLTSKLLKKTAEELVKLGKTTDDLPAGISIAIPTQPNTKPFFRISTSVTSDFQNKKILKNPKFRTRNNRSMLTEALEKPTTLDKAIKISNDNTKLVYGNFKVLDQKTLDKLLKTKTYKNLQGKKEIANQLNKDQYMTPFGKKFIGQTSEQIENKFGTYKIPSSFDATGKVNPRTIKLSKEKTKRMKKIASYIEKNPSLFTGTTKQSTENLKLLANKFKTNLKTTQHDVASLLNKSINKDTLSVGQRGIKISKKLEKILEKIPTQGVFVKELLADAGYSKKTLNLKENIEMGLRQLGKNRKNFDHTLPMAVIKAANLPRSYKARGAHHSFAYNMAKKDYDKKLVNLVSQRQNRVTGGKGLTESQYKQEVDKLREFFGKMTGGSKPGYITIADDGTVTVKDAGAHLIKDKINDVGAQASGAFRYFENAKYHNALWKN